MADFDDDDDLDLDVDIDDSHRSLFADFYGLSLDADGGDVDTSGMDPYDRNDTSEDSLVSDSRSGSESSSTRTSRFSSTSSIDLSKFQRAPSEVTADNLINLDHKHFDADVYVDGLLSEHGIDILVERNNQMVAAKKRLDSAMQTLVYQNYNKFIDATDKMREMKSHVTSMEEEMNSLLGRVQKISKSCGSIEDTLVPNRSKVENLVGVSRLLTKLEFLFELPKRLKQSIAIESHAQAVRYFSVSNNILRKYNHIPSFERIRIESEAIIDDLKVTLRAAVKDGTGDPVHQMETVGLLIQLNEPLDELLTNIFKTRRAVLKRATQEAIATFRLNNPRDSADTKAKAKDEAKDEAEEQKAEPSAQYNNLIYVLQLHLLDPFNEFVDAIHKTCVTPYNNQGPSSNNPSALVRHNLVDFTLDVFGGYFAAATEELLWYADIRNSSGETKETVSLLTDLVRNFYTSIELASRKVPKAELKERAVQAVDAAIHRCVQSVFEDAQTQMVVLFHDLHAQVESFHQSSINGTDDSQEGEQISAPSTSKIAKELRVVLEASIRVLVDVMNMTSVVSVSVGFDELLHSSLRSMFEWMRDTILCDVVNDTQTTVCTPGPTPSPLSKLSTLSGFTYPMFFLYMSHVLLDFEKKEITAVLKTLKQCFPTRSQARKSFDSDVPTMLGTYRSCAALLLQRYVEVNAYRLSDLMRAEPNSDAKDAQQMSISPGLIQMTKELAIIGKELAIIFPKARKFGAADRDIKGRDVGRSSGGSRNSSRGGQEIAVNRHFERLFTQKITIFGAVKFTRSSPYVGVLKALFKCLIEDTRASPAFSKAVYQQLQLDVYALRVLTQVSFISQEDFKVLNLVIDEVIASGSDRCTERNPGLEDAVISSVYERCMSQQ